MKDRIDTGQQTPSSKKELIASSHPVIRMIRELPQVIFPGDEGRLPEETCSLKALFGRELMDRYHVERRRLFSMALSVAALLEGFRQRKIYPGLLDLEDLVVDPGKEDSPVYLLHPDRFQILFFEQDYEWYPEDERLLGDGLFFDEERQLLADQRLIYRILIGSSRGNIKIPPAKSDVDYAHLFYEQLPGNWKEKFENHEVWTHMQMIDQLKKQIMLDQAGSPGKNISQPAKARQDSSVSLGGEPLFCTYVLLRTQLRYPFGLEKIFYEQLEAVENEADLAGRRIFSSLVYGDQVVEARTFREYPRGFRFELPQEIRDYSFGEALVIARDMIEGNMARQGQGQGDHRLYIFLDGKIKNDLTFQKMVEELERMTKRGLTVSLLESGECYCEAKEQLCRLVN